LSALFLEIFSELRKMDVDSAANAVKEEQLPLEETDDNPYGCKITNIISLARDADGSCTTECVSGDCPAEVKQEDCTVVKQEPDDVHCVTETDNPYGFRITNIVSLARNADGSYTTECVSGDWSAEAKQENSTVVKQEPDDVCCVIFASSITQYCSCTPFSVYHATGATHCMKVKSDIES